MSNNLLNCDIKYNHNDHNYKIGDDISCKINLTVNSDLMAESVSYKLVLKTTGRMSSDIQVLKEGVLATNLPMREGQMYHYEIDQQVLHPCSYEGKNFKQEWSIVFEIDVDSKSKSEIRSRFMSGLNLIKAFSIDKLLRHEEEFTVLPEHLSYEVRSAEEKPNFFNLGVFAIILPVGIMLAFFLGNAYSVPVALGVVFFLLLISGTYAYLYYIFAKDIKISVTHLDDRYFEVTVYPGTMEKHISTLEADYKITEAVKDRRGTSTSTSHHIIYDAPNFDVSLDPGFSTISRRSSTILDSGRNVRRKGKPQKLNFKYPDIHIPEVMALDVEIQWKINLMLKTKYGLRLTLKADLNVITVHPEQDVSESEYHS